MSIGGLPSGSKYAGQAIIVWLESTRGLILDGVDYFQVVFTLPRELARLALGNRRLLYDLLFSSALKETISGEQGYDPAALLVLHTWNQRLDAHPHVYAVVPGGGPAIDGSGWRVAQRDSDPSSAGRYLVDADELRRVYRNHFLRGLSWLRERGRLQLDDEFEALLDEEHWQQLLRQLQTTNWVSYIEPPPSAACGVEPVLKYLTRYLTGGPIADSRIVSADDQQVTFLAREGTTPGGAARQVPMTLSRVEFTRRWCLHILPKGYTKTRRYGGWSNLRRDVYLEQCCQLLDASDASLSAGATEFAPFQFEEDSVSDAGELCSKCGHQMILQGADLKPSWHDIFSSAWRPSWYQRPPHRL